MFTDWVKRRLSGAGTPHVGGSGWVKLSRYSFTSMLGQPYHDDKSGGAARVFSHFLLEDELNMCRRHKPQS